MTKPAAYPVIIDTDIGGDIDDTWAVLQALRCPELDIRLVLTCSGDVEWRARLTTKFLSAVGRDDIPVGAGVAAPMDRKWASQADWVGDHRAEAHPGGYATDGIDRMIREVEVAPGLVTILCIAEATNLAEFVRRRPDLVPRCRLVGMFGSFFLGYGGRAEPSAERNVKVDPAGLRVALAAKWADVVITPLDTCGMVILDGARYARLRAEAARAERRDLRALFENYASFARGVVWTKCDFEAERSTTLFDSVAVHLAYDETPFVIEERNFEVTDTGYTLVKPEGPLRARLALAWAAGGQKRFLDELTLRLACS
jgi:inosine-uridine nucleoside N-ribohydrolase